MYLDHGNDTRLTTERGLRHDYLQRQPQASIHLPENSEQINAPSSHSVAFNTTFYSDPCVDEPSYHAEAGPSYQLPRGRTSSPPPPPPPYNVGYIPTFLPINDDLFQSFTDVPSSREALSQRVPPDVVQEISAEALAAGAVIFGEDFLSGFDLQ